jgi:hypothetical protein
MAKYFGVYTAGFLQSIRENRESAVVQRASRQVALLIGGQGEMDDGGIIPGEDGGGDSDGAEGIADHITKQGSLSFFFCSLHNLTLFKVGVAVLSEQERRDRMSDGEGNLPNRISGLVVATGDAGDIHGSVSRSRSAAGTFVSAVNPVGGIRVRGGSYLSGGGIPNGLVVLLSDLLSGLGCVEKLLSCSQPIHELLSYFNGPATSLLR